MALSEDQFDQSCELQAAITDAVLAVVRERLEGVDDDVAYDVIQNLEEGFRFWRATQ